MWGLASLSTGTDWCYHAVTSNSMKLGILEATRMKSQDNADLVRKYYAAIDDRQFDLFQSLFETEYTLHFDGMPAMNAEAAASFFGAFIGGFPDIQHTIHDLLVDGDRVAARVEVTGTHQGEFRGIPPTGNSM